VHVYEFLPQVGAKSDSKQGTRMPHAAIDDRVLVNEGASEADDQHGHRPVICNRRRLRDPHSFSAEQ
jgi:hypothetical protein